MGYRHVLPVHNVVSSISHADDRHNSDAAAAATTNGTREAALVERRPSSNGPVSNENESSSDQSQGPRARSGSQDRSKEAAVRSDQQQQQQTPQKLMPPPSPEDEHHPHTPGAKKHAVQSSLSPLVVQHAHAQPQGVPASHQSPKDTSVGSHGQPISPGTKATIQRRSRPPTPSRLQQQAVPLPTSASNPNTPNTRRRPPSPVMPSSISLNSPTVPSPGGLPSPSSAGLPSPATSAQASPMASRSNSQDQTSGSEPLADSTSSLPRAAHVLPPQLFEFSHRELREATGGFSRRHYLGEGGFGKVYRGVLKGKGLRRGLSWNEGRAGGRGGRGVGFARQKSEGGTGSGNQAGSESGGEGEGGEGGESGGAALRGSGGSGNLSGLVNGSGSSGLAGLEVAVKTLSDEGLQGTKEWMVRDEGRGGDGVREAR